MGPSLTSSGAAPQARRHLDALSQPRRVPGRIAPSCKQDIVDIMLVSASNLELLIERGVFNKQHGEAGDPRQRHDRYLGLHAARPITTASRPFRTANLSHVMYSAAEPTPEDLGTDLGLYSITFNNDIDADCASLEDFSAFRADAAEQRLQVFPRGVQSERRHRIDPEHRAALHQRLHPALPRRRHEGGAAAIPEDRLQWAEGAGGAGLLSIRSLVVGMLGGGAGTTRDCSN